MDLSLLLTQTKAAVSIARFIKDSSDTLDKSGQKLKLAELIDALADIKIETAEIKSLIIEKDEKIQSLETQLKLKNDLIYEAPYYWMETKKGEREGPFCQQCYDSSEKLIRLQVFGSNDRWKCHNCDNVFNGKSYISPQRKQRIVISKGFAI
jgi:ribosomal protein L37AE/L43A